MPKLMSSLTLQGGKCSSILQPRKSSSLKWSSKPNTVASTTWSHSQIAFPAIERTPWLLMLPMATPDAKSQWTRKTNKLTDVTPSETWERGDHHHVIIKRSGFILSLMQSVTSDSKAALLHEATSLLLQKTVSALALSLCALSASACF
jgi:hypothetical protein